MDRSRCPHGFRCLFLALFACAAITALAKEAEPGEVRSQLAGRPLQEVLDAYRDSGLPLIYSTGLVPPSLVVLAAPAATEPVPRLLEILQPHGLTLKQVDGALLVVRIESGPGDGEVPAAQPPEPATGIDIPPELETLTVTASRYVLWSNSQFLLDQRAIQALPDLGEDPVRSVQRLPGAAASGLSTRSHFRGGQHNENGIYLNGLKLLDPFHIRDYHSIFSAIDAHAIAGVEAYTGGFPADYGDQMSGVMLFNTVIPEEARHSEIGISVYNTSLLTSGHTADGRRDWLLSARDSNLDRTLNNDLGEPDYFDIFASAGIELTPEQRLVFNALYADDQVLIITEDDPAELEQSLSNTRSEQYWLTLESAWTADLFSQTVLYWQHLENSRVAEANDPERVIAAVSDWRDADVLGLAQNWRYGGWVDHVLQWGWVLRDESAHYDYRSQAEYRGLFEEFPGIENPRVSVIETAPQGSSYGLFLSDRWQITPDLGVEAGLRWDRQTYTGAAKGSQISPRLSLGYRLNEATTLRFTWGRYYQSQAIQELQVEDGIDHYFRPQRADHWIAGLQRDLGNGWRMRIETYLKDYQPLSPRFENLFDPLALIPELAPDRVRLDPASARARGIEITLDYEGEELDAWTSVAWSKATDRIRGRNQDRSWDQTWAIQGGLAWRHGPWEIGAAFNVHTGWPTTPLYLDILVDEDDEPIYVPLPGPRNSERFRTFAQLDFRVSRAWELPRGKLSAFFEVTNLSNRANPCCVDYDIDEDADGNVYLDGTVEHWLPIIPAVGVLWEF